MEQCEFNECRRCGDVGVIHTTELPHPHLDIKIWAIGCGVCDYSIIGNRTEEDAKNDWNVVNPKKEG